MSATDAANTWVSRRVVYEPPASPRLIFHEWGAAGVTICGMDLDGLTSFRRDWLTTLGGRLCRNCEAIKLETKP